MKRFLTQKGFLNRMKLEYTDSSKSVKQKALDEYKGISMYFEKAEAK